jgi:hypothetical protein
LSLFPCFFLVVVYEEMEHTRRPAAKDFLRVKLPKRNSKKRKKNSHKIIEIVVERLGPSPFENFKLIGKLFFILFVASEVALKKDEFRRCSLQERIRDLRKEKHERYNHSGIQ